MELKRITDSSEQHDIDKLIAEENDPKTRLHLMVMNSMNRNLIANTEATNAVVSMVSTVDRDLKAHISSFEAHTKEEAEMLNKGKGMWKVAAWVIGMAQVIGLVIWQHSSNDIASIRSSIIKHDQADLIHDAKIIALEKSIK